MQLVTLKAFEQQLAHHISITKRFAEIENWESWRSVFPRWVQLPPFRGAVVTPPFIEPAKYVSVMAPTSTAINGAVGCLDLPAIL